jgi:hypothetical protein
MCGKTRHGRIRNDNMSERGREGERERERVVVVPIVKRRWKLGSGGLGM